MLGISSYTQDYIDACRARVESQLAAYRDLVGAAPGQAVAAFAPVFFDNMVLVLDSYFLHRLRTKEGKDGNPLNEVRVLCTSMLVNGSVLAADRTIRLKPETSVLGLAVGDEISLDEPAFVRLAEAYFAEIEARFLKED